MWLLSAIANLVGRLRGWWNEPVGERRAAERESAPEPPPVGGSSTMGSLGDDLLGFDDIGSYQDGSEDFE